MIRDFLTLWGPLPDIWNGFLDTLILIIIAATISLLMRVLLTPMVMSSRPYRRTVL